MYRWMELFCHGKWSPKFTWYKFVIRTRGFLILRGLQTASQPLPLQWYDDLMANNGSRFVIVTSLRSHVIGRVIMHRAHT